MRIVRDRRDARWLPSRFHFALFRLFAYFRLRATKPEPVPGLIMAVDRHQSAAENYLVSLCILIAATSYFAAMFEAAMSLPLACALAVPVAAIAIQAAFLLSGMVVPIVRRIVRVEGSDNVAIDSAIMLTLMIAGGLLVAFSDTSARYIARGFLILAALNVVAATLVFLLRNRIADEERRLGVEG